MPVVVLQPHLLNPRRAGAGRLAERTGLKEDHRAIEIRMAVPEGCHRTRTAVAAQVPPLRGRIRGRAESQATPCSLSRRTGRFPCLPGSFMRYLLPDIAPCCGIQAKDAEVRLISPEGQMGEAALPLLSELAMELHDRRAA